MEISYSDAEYINKENVGNSMAALKGYRDEVWQIVEQADFRKSPSSLATYKDEAMLDELKQVVDPLLGARHVIVVGIGGSDLGTRAIHQALSAGNAKQKARFHGLNTSSEQSIAELLTELDTVESVDELAIFSISKSGNTAETITNTAVLFDYLVGRFGKSVYSRAVFIGNPGNPLLAKGEEHGAATLGMHEIVGGRYSVFTRVGLAPLYALGYDIDRILGGVAATMDESNEEMVAESSALLFEYLQHDVRNVKYFSFDTYMGEVGAWWKQLTAESLGKSEDAEGNPVAIGFVPSAATSVSLHSTEQLYFSGFDGVYTDFISLTNPVGKTHKITTKSGIADQYAGKSIGQINKAIEKGVLAAYQDRHLPYRFTRLGKDTEHELGLLMGSRMLETMYVANLMNVNAFDQPNVELYKSKTRSILGV